MTRSAVKSFGRIATIGSCVCFSSLSAVSAAQAVNPAAPSFEIVSVKPNHSVNEGAHFNVLPGRFVATNLPVKFLIEFAYNVKEHELSGGPRWLNSERYDVDAREDAPGLAEAQKLDVHQRIERTRRMLQAVLADRFRLKLIHETKVLPVYALILVRSGIRFSPPSTPTPPVNASLLVPPLPPMIRIRRGEMTFPDSPISALADALSDVLRQKVLDQTGLSGDYDMSLRWTPDEPLGVEGNASEPSLFTAIQEQLGLKLEPQKAPVEILIIDHIETPSAN